MVADRDVANAQSDEAAILRRMLADADRLCASPDPLVAGQCVQLRGRIAALVHLVAASDLLDDPS